MFKGMNSSGRMHATTGLAVSASAWGVLHNVQGGEKSRTRIPSKQPAGACCGVGAVGSSAVAGADKSARSVGVSTGDGADGTDSIVELGPSGTKYSIEVDAVTKLTSQFEKVMKAAGEFPHRWPDGPDEVAPFMAALATFYNAARGGNATYCRKNFTRWAIAALDMPTSLCMPGPDMFKDWTYKAVSEYLPDQKGFLTDHNDMLVRELRSKFGGESLAFWELSMWSCLLGGEQTETVISELWAHPPLAAAAWLREAELNESIDDWWPIQVPETLQEWLVAVDGA
jgi:hypothetical protein